MTCFDVFNGDADGLCALQQLRLAEPLDSTLVTGVKRDIALLERVPASAGDQVSVLDIALDKNRAALVRVLAAGAQVRYFDHHYPGEIPSHPRFACHIETSPDKGTSLLVDEFVGGRFRAWAVVGTFGDNFDAAARRAAVVLGLAAPALERLRDLGICLNYNGYGASVADLHCAPDELYRRLRPYADPLVFMREDSTFQVLSDGYAHDMAQARATVPALAAERHCLHLLPAEPWARRVGGVFANALAQQAPGCAHALLTQLPGGGFVVSVRAPLNRPEGADHLCRQFANGGGRKAAAGINHLPDADYDRFAAAFLAAF
ncbi:acetyltransferase [uncultured Thiodictyon sp.]|uniref:acetyltransferase n=1 Tax=uncultured Thiodictyon sp. TaxID=1846217 RepID=UPI0025E0F5F4|nr:acetyltransferase [uncultured Thiodictyon sp.]